MTESVVVKADAGLISEAERIVKITKNSIGKPLFTSTKDFVDFALSLAIEKYKAEATIKKVETA